MKKIFKVIGIIAAIAAAIAGVYVVVTKFMNKKKCTGAAEENYVSCSCGENDEFKSETVA